MRTGQPRRPARPGARGARRAGRRPRRGRPGPRRRRGRVRRPRRRHGPARLRRRARPPAVGRCRARRAAGARRHLGGRGGRARAPVRRRPPGRDWVLGGPYDPTLAPGGLFDARWLDEAVPDRPSPCSPRTTTAPGSTPRRCAGPASTPAPPTRRPATIAAPPRRLAAGHARRVERDGPRAAPRPAPHGGGEARGAERPTAMLASAGSPGRRRRPWPRRTSRSTSPRPSAARSRCGSTSRCARSRAAGRRSARRSPRPGPPRAARPLREVSARTVKFFADGVIEAGTAALLAPYDDAPHTCGLPVWQPGRAGGRGRRVRRRRLPAAHPRDRRRGGARALDAVEHVTEVNGPRDRRPVVAHTQLRPPRRPAALRRRSGVVANVEPLWTQLDPLQTDLTLPRLGPAPRRAAVPVGLACSRRARCCRWAATGRSAPTGRSRGSRSRSRGRPPTGTRPGLAAARAAARRRPRSRRTPRASAYQAFEERRGARSPSGRRADLVWLDADPLHVGPGTAGPALAGARHLARRAPDRGERPDRDAR